jgi:hypothetical protein
MTISPRATWPAERWPTCCGQLDGRTTMASKVSTFVAKLRVT